MSDLIIEQQKKPVKSGLSLSTGPRSPLEPWAAASGKTVRTARRWAKAGRILGVAQIADGRHYRLRGDNFHGGLAEMRKAQTKAGKRALQEEKMRAAIERIDMRPARGRQFSAEAVAREMGISRATFYRKGFPAILKQLKPLTEDIRAERRQVSRPVRYVEDVSSMIDGDGNEKRLLSPDRKPIPSESSLSYEDRKRQRILRDVQDKTLSKAQRAQLIDDLDAHDAAWVRAHLKR